MCLILGKTDAGVLKNMLLLKRNDELTAISATKLTTIMMIWTMSRMHKMMTSDQVGKNEAALQIAIHNGKFCIIFIILFIVS